MRKASLILCGFLLSLAACGGEDEAELDNQQIANVIENLATAREEPKEKAPSAPALAALEPQEVERIFGQSAGCDFSHGGGLLFVSVAQGSLAKIGNALVHAVPNGPAGPTGGFWASERYAISIGRLAEAGTAEAGTAEENTAGWPARLILTDRRQEENNVTRVEGTWRCRA